MWVCTRVCCKCEGVHSCLSLRSAHVCGTVSGVAVLASFTFPPKFEGPPGDSNACFHPADWEPPPSVLGTAPWEAGLSALSIAPRNTLPVSSLGTLVLAPLPLSPGAWALGLGSEGDVVAYAVSLSLPRWTKTEGGAPAGQVSFSRLPAGWLLCSLAQGAGCGSRLNSRTRGQAKDGSGEKLAQAARFVSFLPGAAGSSLPRLVPVLLPEPDHQGLRKGNRNPGVLLGGDGRWGRGCLNDLLPQSWLP